MKITITKKEVDEKILKIYNLPKETIVEIVGESIAQQILGAVSPKSLEYWTITDKASEKTSEILAKARSLFDVYVYDEKDIDAVFPAPKKDITVSFKKSIEPDEEHRNKSYNDFMSEKDTSYMTMRQYLLLCIYVWETEKQHLDVIGWTRTSSLWSDGRLVDGYWFGGLSGLRLDDGSVGNRNSDCGPRQQFHF
jgi:hypothetical protein